MNKILLLISIPGSYIGGAQKRYLSLFNFICDKRKDYYLVINRKLYLSLKDNSVLKSYDNVRVMTLIGEKKLKSENNLSNIELVNSKEITDKKISRLRSYVGRNKMFLKSIIIWISFIFEFRKILKELKSNIVYAVWTGGIFASPLKKLFKYKLIYSYNDSTLDMVNRNLSGIFNDSEYWVLKNADKIDFLSSGIVESYKRKIGTLDDNRITVTPNSFINYEKYYSESKKENDVVFLSRLWQNKNPLLFLESIKIFNDNQPEYNYIKFYVIGEGGLAENIKEYINRNKLVNTYFIGKTLEPWEYLRKSKVFVSIQQINNYPSQSLLEAMACENAIIASDVGETKLLVTENEGIIVKLKPESIAAAIFKLFSTKGLIEQLGKNARKKVIENHTVEKFAEYFYSITDE